MKDMCIKYKLTLFSSCSIRFNITSKLSLNTLAIILRSCNNSIPLTLHPYVYATCKHASPMPCPMSKNVSYLAYKLKYISVRKIFRIQNFLRPNSSI